MKDYISNFTLSYANLYYGRRQCSSCQSDIWEIYKERAKAEIDKSGPTSERIFATKFLISCIPKSCESCCMALMYKYAESLSALKDGIDRLPNSI